MSMLKFLSRRPNATRSPTMSFASNNNNNNAQRRKAWKLPDVRQQQQQLTKVGSVVQLQPDDKAAPSSRGMLARMAYNNRMMAVSSSRAQMLSGNGTGGSQLFQRQGSRPSRSSSNGNRRNFKNFNSHGEKKHQQETNRWHSKRGGRVPRVRNKDVFARFLRE